MVLFLLCGGLVVHVLTHPRNDPHWNSFGMLFALASLALVWR